MSTRSGKRIHSCHENTVTDIHNNTTIDVAVACEKKKRNRRNKDHTDIDKLKSVLKLRENYVTYPTDDEQEPPPSADTSRDGAGKPTRSLRKNTILKDLNFDSVIVQSKDRILHENGVDKISHQKAERKSRRMVENSEQEAQIGDSTNKKCHDNNKVKKNKKIKKTSIEVCQEEVKSADTNDDAIVPRKKKGSKNKKRNKQRRTIKTPDLVTEDETTSQMIEDKKSISSVDSFHSTISSPAKVSANTDNNGTYDKILNSTNDKNNRTYDKILNNTNDKNNGTYDKILNSTNDKNNGTYDKILNNTYDKNNGTYDKILNSTYDNHNEGRATRSVSTGSKNSIINLTFDRSDRIDITSDDSKISMDNIVNSSPLLIESSIDCSKEPHNTPNTSYVVDSKTPSKLIREGTFTKDDTSAITSHENEGTPNKRNTSLPRPGDTPYSLKTKTSIKPTNLNLTHSIEKPSSLASSSIEKGRDRGERVTKVMFSSPANDKTLASERKSKIIKSSMKGSNKSFFFDNANSSVERQSARKRSYTQNDAEDMRTKRKRLDADGLQESVNRLSKPRTNSTAAGKSDEATTPSKRVSTPYLSKSESKPVRGKLPNFAALHQRRFAKMESLDECQERKAKRAKQLLSPMGSIAVLERKNLTVSTTDNLKTDVKIQKAQQKSIKKVPTFELSTESRPGYTRFGFRMKFDVNPFSVPLRSEKKEPNMNVESKTEGVKPSGTLSREKTQQALIGAKSHRKDVAKQTVLREKSSTALKRKRDVNRGENRVTIKGVRTNRRFELQMMSRNINV